jgi:hypothetical protein
MFARLDMLVSFVSDSRLTPFRGTWHSELSRGPKAPKGKSYHCRRSEWLLLVDLVEKVVVV